MRFKKYAEQKQQLPKLQSKITKPTKLANIEAAVSGSAPLAGKDVQTRAQVLQRASDIQERINKSVTTESSLRKGLQSLAQKESELLDKKAQRIQRNLEKRRQAAEVAKDILKTEKEAAAQAEKAARAEKQRSREAIKRRDNIRKIREARSSRFREDLALGAGFPLLFGGGAGAVGGGVLGALAGQGKEALACRFYLAHLVHS